MFLETWMLILLVGAFGACAYYSFSSGRKAGIIDGILGTFSYLETNNIVSFAADGSLKGGAGTLSADKIIRSLNRGEDD